ncbi:uncharacterized protein RBU33_022842 isoform 1-T1 [Hipposideros larvatus]
MSLRRFKKTPANRASLYNKARMMFPQRTTLTLVKGIHVPRLGISSVLSLRIHLLTQPDQLLVLYAPFMEEGPCLLCGEAWLAPRQRAAFKPRNTELGPALAIIVTKDGESEMNHFGG